MRLNTLSPAEGSKKAGKRLGRGIGSGLGKTRCRYIYQTDVRQGPLYHLDHAEQLS